MRDSTYSTYLMSALIAVIVWSACNPSPVEAPTVERITPGIPEEAVSQPVLVPVSLPDLDASATRVTLTPPPPPPYSDAWFDGLLPAIEQVESNGYAGAHARGEQALGILQIRPIMVDDCNRIMGAKVFHLHDRWSVKKSRAMFRLYTKHYGLNTYEKAARGWNGGPNGWSKRATLGYWNRVQRQLKEAPTTNY